MEKSIETRGFKAGLKNSLKTDFRRLRLSRFFLIILLASFVAPILMLVMTTALSGSVTTDQNGNQTVIEGFDFVWQILGDGAASPDEAMGMTAMCNANLLVFAFAVLVALFVTDDFSSGFIKCSFASNPGKSEYVASKILVCSLGSAATVVAFALGSVIGGAVSGLPFLPQNHAGINVPLCLLCKVLIAPACVSIFTLASVIAKRKKWLALVLSLGSCALLFTTLPLLSPLQAAPPNAIVCLAVSAAFAVIFGLISKIVLEKTDLV